MDELTETFRRLVERSQATPAQWMLWLLRELEERACDPATRLELRLTLTDSAARLQDAQAALDAVGEIVAEAGLARRNYAERLERALGATSGQVLRHAVETMQPSQEVIDRWREP